MFDLYFSNNSLSRSHQHTNALNSSMLEAEITWKNQSKLFLGKLPED